MIFNQLSLGIGLRLLLLFAMLNVANYCVQYLFFPQIITATLVIFGQLWELVRYITRGQNELARFLSALKHRDFSLQFTELKTRSDLLQLHQIFNQLNQTFSQLQIEKEAQFQLLQSILQILDTGIIVFAEDGEVLWVNDAFKKTLSLPHIKNIHSLQKRQPNFYQSLLKLNSSGVQLLKLKTDQNQEQLLVSSRSFKMQQRNLTLLALKNVSDTVDQAETEAWQKLLRVMTHEIMNSVAPISSLAETMLKHLHLDKEKYLDQNQPQPNQELLQDTEEVISVIQNRSEGLLQFARIYRNLSKINNVLLTTVFVQELFHSVSTLMQPRLQQDNILFSTHLTNPDLTLQADTHLLEQVLINLILNAQHAVKNHPNPTIKLNASQLENGHVVIEVIDNGTGIPEELLDSIFIPFFTSHKDGSGIGLSLAKQIMSLHKGNIQVKSKVGDGTVFSLNF